MSNMSYCRFQNTLSDFRDCVENIRNLNPEDNGQNNRYELAARVGLVELSMALLEELGYEIVGDMTPEKAVSDLGYDSEDEDEYCNGDDNDYIYENL